MSYRGLISLGIFFLVSCGEISVDIPKTESVTHGGRIAGSPAAVRETWILVAEDRGVSIADVTQLAPILVDSIDLQPDPVTFEEAHALYFVSAYNRTGAVTMTEGGPQLTAAGAFPAFPGAWYQIFRTKLGSPDRVEVFLLFTNGSGGTITVDYTVWKAAGVNR